MKILYFLNSDFGVQNTIGIRPYYIAKELNKNDLFIFCRDYNSPLKNQFNILKTVPFGKKIMQFFTAIPIYIYNKFPSNIIKNNIFEFFLIKKLKKIDLSKVKVIHSWDFLPNVYKYVKSVNSNIKIFQDVPMALENPFVKNYILPKYISDSFEYIDYFIIPSDFVKDSLLELNISKKKIIKFPFGVDTRKFKLLKNKDFSGKFKVAFSGNVNLRKGLNYLIEAWKELNLKDAEINLYGRVYPEVSILLKNSKKYNINIYGFVDTKTEILKNHIYIFPSLLEGSAKSIYEALASGLPVITTYNSGSIIEDGKEGFIIPVKDKESIKKSILYFYNNRNKIQEFGLRARKLSVKYTWENYAKSIIKCYKKK